MYAIMGSTVDEKFQSVQQILNALVVKNFQTALGGLQATLKEYWAVLPSDLIIFRHLFTRAGTFGMIFKAATFDAINTTLEITLTDSAGTPVVTTYPASSFTSGLSIDVKIGDTLALKMVVAGGGTNPTGIWVTGELT